MTGTPMIGIAYHIKTREFMKQFDCEEFCIDDSDLTAKQLISAINRLIPNVDTIGPQLFVRAKEMSCKVKDDLRDFFNNVTKK